MTTHVNTKEKSHKLFELIEYYEVCNRAEGKSPKTISWYSANLKSFRNYLKNRHLPDSLDNIDTKLLREYVLYLMKRTRGTYVISLVYHARMCASSVVNMFFI